MLTQKRIVSVTACSTTIILATVICFSTMSFCTTGLQVYNVVTYGADPTGAADSSAAVNSAISAAMNAASPGGIINFPAGTFLINGAVSANMHQLNLVGSGVNSTVIVVGSSGSFTLTSPITLPYHGGSVKDFALKCSGSNTGIITQDALGIKWSNVALENCPTAVDMQNVNAWTERNDFDDVTFYNCGVAIHFDRTSSASQTVSFGYNDFRIWVNADAPGTIFLLSGGGQAYGSTYSVQGNLAAGSIVFDAHSDGHANPMYNDTFFVKVEDNSSTGTSYIFDAHDASGPSGEVHGVGQFQYGSHTQWAAPGSATIAVTNILNTPTDVTAVTIGSGSTDVYSNLPIVTPNSHCFVQPNNSTAASLTNVWVSSVGWGQIVLSHPTSHAGAAFELWCHS